jgi:hypothetical protein
VEWEFPDQISWLGIVLLAGLPGFTYVKPVAVSGGPAAFGLVPPYAAFVTLTVAGRRELYTPLP